MSQDGISILNSEAQTRTSTWQKQDTIWMLSLYGTAIGAGTLFLPINAGLHGIWPMIIMAILVFPMTYYSHQALCRFVQSGSCAKKDITEVVEEHFGRTAGKLITLMYFFAIYPILLMYSVAITNTTESFIVNQIGISPPPRALLAIILIMALMAIVRLGQDIILKSMSILVYPFIAILIFLSLYLIPYWNDAVFQSGTTIQNSNPSDMLMTLWLIIPVMVFSFNHSPIISSFALYQKQKYGEQADAKSSEILKYSHLLMVMTVMFFVFSCVLSLSPQDLVLAKAQNISILSYLANHFKTPIMAYIAPFIAFIAIAKSFLGHYLGASEGLQGLIVKSFRVRRKPINKQKLTLFIKGFMIISCWVIATINPNILTMIETLGGPVIALILFIMPMYAILKVPAMKKYRHPIINTFIALIGIIAISAILYGLIVVY